MARIGFIGLGNMGAPMALNLLKAGHTLKVFDLLESSRQLLVEAGAAAVQEAPDVVRDADAVVTMLPAGPQVRSVYLGSGSSGADGLFAVARKGTLFMDCSTIDVSTARDVMEKAEQAGMLMVDAPVSGGVGGAQAGTLTMMVGGTPTAFEAASPLLEAVGKNIFHAGQAGNGQAAKLCNNMLLGISMIGTAEAFVLGEKLGLDTQTFFDIASTASGQCWSMTSYCPAPGPVRTAPSNNDYEPGFTAAMMLKDLRLSQEAAQASRTTTPMGAQAAALYGLMESSGKDGLDFSAVIKLLKGEL